MTTTASRIVAEVWDRYLLPIPGSDPVSRHRTLAAAHLACARANYLQSDPDGRYSTPDGQPPCVVYAVRTHDRYVEVEIPVQVVGSSPDPDYCCGADYCDDPACTLHGHHRSYTPHGPPDLTIDEAVTVHIIRALIVLDRHPYPAVVDAVLATAAEVHTHGHPFNPQAVLATLYPCQTETGVSHD